MIASLVPTLLAAAALAAPPDPATPATAGSPDVVRVSLRAEARVTSPQVSVGDVAAITGGPDQLRLLIAGLDLVDPAPSEQEATVTREQVAYRIQIVGVEPRLFQMEGSPRVAVTVKPYQFTEADVLAAARDLLQQRLPWQTANLTVQLTRPIQLPRITVTPADKVRVEAALPTGASIVGRVRVEVSVLVNGQKRGTIPVLFEVKLFQQVAIAKRRIERGEVFSEDNLHVDQRASDGTANYASYKDLLSGKRATRAILPGQVIGRGDMEATSVDNPVLVKQRDLVKVVARVGKMRVSMLGEALQDGRAGQLIRVRNVDSKSVVVGRVVDRSLVEVDF
jgi:flagella basal body P-ring formation protein FlgA